MRAHMENEVSDRILAVQDDRLDGKDYINWTQRMERILRHAKLWTYITGNVPSGAQPSQQWVDRDKKVQDFLFRHLSNELCDHVSSCQTAAAMWTRLRQKFASQQATDQMELKNAWATVKMTAAETLQQHQSRVQKLAKRMSLIGIQVDEHDQVLQFASGLKKDQKHDNIGSNISNTDGPLTWRRVDQQLRYAKIRGVESAADPEQTVLMSVRQPHRQSGDGTAKTTLRCKKCKLRNRTTEVCRKPGRGAYHEGGGSDGGQSSSSGATHQQTRPQTGLQCWSCGEYGHKTMRCLKLAFKPNYAGKQAHVAVAQPDDASDDHSQQANNPGYLGMACAAWASTAMLAGLDQTGCYMDSGATHHICSEQNKFSVLKETAPAPVHTPDGIVHAIGIGKVMLHTISENGVTELTLSEVLHVPNIKANLFSLMRVIDMGLTFTGGDEGIKVSTKAGYVFAIGKRLEGRGLCKLQIKTTSQFKAQPKQMVALKASTETSSLWHQRLGHVNHRTIDYIKQHQVLTGMDAVKADSNDYVGCILGKQHRQSFASLLASHRKHEKLELVHSYLCGPMNVASIGGKKYMLTFIDDKTRRIWTYFLDQKSKVLDCFKPFRAAVQIESGKKLQALRSDRGGEYTSNAFKEYCQRKGIRQELTEGYSPQQNGVAERANRTLVEMARSMLHHHQLPHSLWAEALRTAAYLRNRCPTQSLGVVTPEEAWTGSKPDVSHLRTFGCIGYCHVPDEKRKKLDVNSRACILIGYEKSAGTYRLLDPADNNRLVVTREVPFQEAESGAKLYLKQLSQPTDTEKEYVFKPLLESSEETTSADSEAEAVSNDIASHGLPIQSSHDHSLDEGGGRHAGTASAQSESSAQLQQQEVSDGAAVNSTNAAEEADAAEQVHNAAEPNAASTTTSSTNGGSTHQFAAEGETNNQQPALRRSTREVRTPAYLTENYHVGKLFEIWDGNSCRFEAYVDAGSSQQQECSTVGRGNAGGDLQPPRQQHLGARGAAMKQINSEM